MEILTILSRSCHFTTLNPCKFILYLQQSLSNIPIHKYIGNNERSDVFLLWFILILFIRCFPTINFFISGSFKTNYCPIQTTLVVVIYLWDRRTPCKLIFHCIPQFLQIPSPWNTHAILLITLVLHFKSYNITLWNIDLYVTTFFIKA